MIMVKRFRGVALTVVLIVGAAPAIAQTNATTDKAPASAEDQATQPVTLAEVEAALAAIDSDERLDDAAKSRIRSRYQQAIDALQASAEYREKAAAYTEALTSAPEQTAETRRQLRALPPPDAEPELSETDDADELQGQVDLQRNEVDALNEEHDQVTSDLTRIKSRPVELSSRVSEVQCEIDEIRKRLSSAQLAPDLTSPGRVADRTLLKAQQQRLLSEQQMLEQEQPSLSVCEDLLSARREFLQRQVEIAASKLSAMEKRLSTNLIASAKRWTALVDSLTEEIPHDDTRAQELASEVSELADEFQHVVLELQQVTEAQNSISEFRRTLDQEYARVQEELALGGGGVAMMQLLYRLQARAVSARADLATPGLPTLDETRLASLRLREKLDEQAEIERSFTDESGEAVRRLISTRRDASRRLHPRAVCCDCDRFRIGDECAQCGLGQVRLDCRRPQRRAGFWIARSGGEFCLRFDSTVRTSHSSRRCRDDRRDDRNRDAHQHPRNNDHELGSAGLRRAK